MWNGWRGSCWMVGSIVMCPITLNLLSPPSSLSWMESHWYTFLPFNSLHEKGRRWVFREVAWLFLCKPHPAENNTVGTNTFPGITSVRATCCPACSYIYVANIRSFSPVNSHNCIDLWDVPHGFRVQSKNILEPMQAACISPAVTKVP